MDYGTENDNYLIGIILKKESKEEYAIFYFTMQKLTKSIKNYDKEKDFSYLLYLNKESLCGLEVPQKLSVSRFKCMTKSYSNLPKV